MTSYQVIARKYRPKTFKEVLGQGPIVQTLKNALRRSTLSHAYLFSGSRGTGKTTLARILAKALNCTNRSEDFEPCATCKSCVEISQGNSLDVIEIDGASHRGIDDIKTISESVGYCPAQSAWKIYIIDEVHMLTKEAFNALLKTLEEPPANVKFFFATTEPHKVPETILSRCQRFTLQRIPSTLIVEKLERIAADCQIAVDKAALFRIARFAEGGLRDAESIFDQLLSYAEGTLTVQTVNDVLGILPYEHFLELDQATLSNDVAFAYRLADKIFREGKELTHFLDDLTQHYKAILFTKIGCSDLIEHFDETYKEGLAVSCKQYTEEQCLYILDTIMQTQQTIRQAISQQIALEHLLIKITRAKLRIPADYLIRRLSELEERLGNHGVPTKPKEAKAAEPPISTPAPKPQKEKVPKQAPEKQPAEKQLSVPQTDLNPVSIENDAKTRACRDTLLQFAAVELEGTVRKEKRSQ